MDINRKTAFQVLNAMEKDSAYSNIELNSRIKENKPDSPAFVRELVYGVTENRMYLDWILNNLVKRGVKSVKKEDLSIMRMAIFQVEFMDSVPDYAAVNEAVRLAKKYARGRDRFVNGVLRNYLRKREQIKLPDRDENPVLYLSIRYSCHISIVNLWMEQLGYDKTEEILKWSNTVPPVNIRVNLIKTTVKELEESLKNKGFLTAPGKLSERTLEVKGGGLLETEEFSKGFFSVQDSPSVFAAELLSPEKGDRVIDMCSAPGGKTLAMAEIMEDCGRITACDFYENRLGPVKKEAIRLGINSVITEQRDGCEFENSFVEKFDRVLCDVPCTGLGVIRRKPEIKYKKIEDGGRELACIQMKILKNGAEYLKPGGKLVYSTCTVNYNENEKIIETFLARNKGYRLIYMKQFMPEDGCDGFFTALMEKSGGRDIQKGDS